MSNICAVCQFCTYEDGRPPETYCHNEHSQNFGKMLSAADIKKPGCADFSPAIYKDMSLKDALRIFMMECEGSTPMYVLPSSTIRPLLAIHFKDNKQMADWRNAMTRLFMEYLKMAEKDGDFIDESQET